MCELDTVAFCLCYWWQCLRAMGRRIYNLSS